MHVCTLVYASVLRSVTSSKCSATSKKEAKLAAAAVLLGALRAEVPW